MPSKNINQLTALDVVASNLSNTLFVVYDSETGTTKKATLSQIDTAIERSIQNVSSAAVYANAAFMAANTANVKLQSAYDVANTLFNATAYANVAAITANTISTIDLVSSNTVVANNVIISGILDVDGVQLVWHTPPTTSKGSSGDVAGLIAIDNDKLYRCVGTYDGTTDIWRFINFTGGTWG